MGRTVTTRPTRVHHVFSLGAKIATVVAAMATVLGYVHSVGLDGSTTRRTVGTFGASWLGLTPGLDTLWAIGDTLHVAATVTDRHGTALVGATIAWSSSDSTVVTAGDGLVVARSPGSATVVASVGELVARSRVVVRPRVAAVHLANDSSIVVAESATRAISVRTTDSRGYMIAARAGTWRSLDTNVVAVDSGGHITGVSAGHATVAWASDGVVAQVLVTVVPEPGAIAVVAGDGQDGAAGTLLASPVTVRLTSRRGRPLAGELVRFRRVDGSGAADVGAVVTDGDGRARTSWRLGDIPGRQRLIASIEGLDSAAMVTAEAEPLAANTRVTAEHDEQVGPIATRLADRVSVHLADTSGRPLADVPVVWATMDGGSVTPIAARTDSMGDITASWVLGPTARRQRLRATVGNGRLVRPTILHALALPGPAASVSAVSGSGQQGVAGKELANPVILRVTDAAGNAVPNVRITLRPSGGVLADSAPATDSLGAVRARWTLPGETHNTPLHLSARVDGIVRPVVVVASMVATPAPPPSPRHHHHAT
jgi:5-hydroxyisourate hydrolase-like protein (transthyretin family)